MPLETFQFPFFGTDRTIRVYVPKILKQECPVLYMHDGQNVFTDDGAIGGESLRLKSYLEETEMPLIVVAIDLNLEGEERINEYCPWPSGALSGEIFGHESKAGGKGSEYLETIVVKLKPYIDSHYRAAADETYMAGISLGGLITTYAACRYPNVFKRVAALSPAYFRNQEQIESIIAGANLSALEKIYVDCGTNEVPGDAEKSQKFAESIRSVYHLLQSKGLDSRFEQIEGAEHNYVAFRKRMPKVLASIQGGI
ncbi:MAG TPA: alpha/beta hydrolase-fold protein [Bacillales bacterium]|nr:alpha/beta hydrolase-fold protein [Bacillales bacterium]